MDVKKTQKILYSINKATHYRQLENIKSTIDNSYVYHYTPKHHLQFSYSRRQQIKHNDRLMISKILQIAKADTLTRKKTLFRPTKRVSFRQWEINQENQRRNNRIQSMKPAVGSISTWKKQYAQKSMMHRQKIYDFFHEGPSPIKLAIKRQNKHIFKTLPSQVTTPFFPNTKLQQSNYLEKIDFQAL